MKKWFWAYLILGITLMAFFAVCAVFFLIPSLLRDFVKTPAGIPLILLSMVGLVMIMAARWKIQSMKSGEGEDAGKAMLKRYKVIDRVVLGFCCLSVVSWLISIILFGIHG